MKLKNLYVMSSVFVFLTMSVCASAAPASAPQTMPEVKKETSTSSPHWSYEGDTGPEHWGSLDPSFAACANGTEQSPIDIELKNVKVNKTVGKIRINYKPTAFTIMNNGHTIQANDASGSNSIIVDGEKYKLIQMHFHKPSEHEINGENFMMEGHLVHKNKTGNLAVLGFLIKAGNENEQLAEMWAKLPRQETESDIALDNLIDLVQLLPNDNKVFRYSGSLTTPPCTEGVKWAVLKKPIKMSQEQIDTFGTIFPHNNRPVQPINDRIVTNM